MPTYEYRCLQCQYEFELFQAMSDKPIKKCPRCNRLSVKRLISNCAGIIFKGSGFYATDYKKGAPQERGNSVSSQKKCATCSPSPNSCSSCKK